MLRLAALAAVLAGALAVPAKVAVFEGMTTASVSNILDDTASTPTGGLSTSTNSKLLSIAVGGTTWAAANKNFYSLFTVNKLGAGGVYDTSVDFTSAIGVRDARGTASADVTNNVASSTLFVADVSRLAANGSATFRFATTASVLGSADATTFILSIDVTAPTPVTTTLTSNVFVDGRLSPAAIPSTLFVDDVSTSFTVTSATVLGESKNIALVDSTGAAATYPVALSSLFVGSTYVLAPTGNVLIDITAEDAAGNAATARLIVPVTQAPVSGCTLSVKGSTTVTRDNLVTGTLPISVSCPSTVDISTVLSSGTDLAVYAYSAAGALSNSSVAFRVYNRVASGTTVTATLYDIATAQAEGDFYTVQLVPGSATAVNDASKFVAGSNVVQVYVDTTAPTGTAISDFNAAAGSRLDLILNYIFSDNQSPAEAITVINIPDANGRSTGLGNAASCGTLAIVKSTVDGLYHLQGQLPSYDGNCTFGLNATDEAGNYLAAALVTEITYDTFLSSTYVAGATLTIPSTVATVAIGTPVAVASGGTVTTPGNVTIGKVVFTLLNADDATAAQTASSNTVALAAGQLEGFTLSPAITGTTIATSAGTVTATGTSVAWSTLIAAVKYSAASACLSKRNKYVQIKVYAADGTTLIASGSRAFTVGNAAAPTVSIKTGGAATAITFAEVASGAVQSSKNFGIAAADKITVCAPSGTVTSLSIKLASCIAYESIDLVSTYTSVYPPPFSVTYNSRACALVLSAYNGVPRPVTEAVAILDQLRYRNSGGMDPAGFLTGSAITGATSSAVPARNIQANAVSGRFASAWTTVATLAMTLTDDAPVFNGQALKLPPFINTTAGNRNGNHFFVVGEYSSLRLNLTATGPGQLGGILYDPDTPVSGLTVTLLVNDISGVTTSFTGGTYAATTNTTIGALPAWGTTNGISASSIVPAAGGIIFQLNGTATSPNSNAAAVSPKGVIRVADSTGFAFQEFNVDFHLRGCMVDTTQVNATGVRGAAPLTSSDSSAAYNAKYTIPGACYTGVTMDTASGGTLSFNPPGSNTGFATLSDATDPTSPAGKAAALGCSDSLTDADAIKNCRTQLANAAKNAAGAFAMGVPAGALTSPVDITATQATSAVVAMAPAPAAGAVQTAYMIKAGPDGLTFEKPVQMCLFVGPIPEGYSTQMYVASAKFASDPTQGYQDWEPLQDQTINPFTGQICGYTTHFSLFAPISAPLPVTPTVPKAHFMGGSCPNGCSGKGFCRQEGKCACFQGFTGYDCSLRTCPSADAWGEDQTIVHAASECAGRGLCDRTTGACACFEGFEGAACERSSCPNDCSGHGKCRLLAELPQAQSVGYSSWETEHIQLCVCDGGYTGADCSQRTCPRGDDPETVCSTATRNVQTVTLSFGTMPSNPTNGIVAGADEELILTFQDGQGRNYTTGTIGEVWSSNGAANLEAALKSLPQFAISDVTVTGPSTFSSSAASVAYAITFDGDNVPGNQAQIFCPAIMGCPAAGCQPRHKQLRATGSWGGNGVVENVEATLLKAPTTGSPVAGTFNVVLTINLYTRTVGGVATPTYEVISTVFGVAADTIAEQPLPPTAAGRTAVPLLYGLVVDMSGYSASSATVTFAWSLPTCSVTTSSAAPDLEFVECSNRGICDRSTGECACFNGYSGYACSSQVVVV